MQRIEMNNGEMQKNGLQRNDLLFARRSLVESGAGKASIVCDLDEQTTFESSIIRVRLDENKCCPLFYLYWLRSYAGREAISSLVNGVNVKGIRASALKDILVDYPHKKIQRRIADILSAYDDLIENNRKQIKLLEEAAQRLYREWFVDLRFPGHEDTAIVDGVPEGWKREKVANVCETVGGGTPSTKIPEYFEGGSIYWVTPTDITRNNSLILLDTEKKITSEGLKNSSAKIVPPYTILMTSRASIGYFGLCEYEVCTNQGFISCIPATEEIRFYLLYNLICRVDEIGQKASGSTFLEISKREFRNFDILTPDKSALIKFNEIVINLVGQMEVRGCRQENKKYVKLIKKYWRTTW